MSRKLFIPSEGDWERKQLAQAYSGWLSNQAVDLFVTLNFNRERNLNGAKHQYGHWLARIDRKYLGRRWCRRGDQRTFAIAIIENPETNIHLHALVRLPQRACHMPYPEQAELLRGFWSELQPAGSSDVQQIDYLPPLAGYICKQLHWRGHLDNCIIMSSEFHSHG